MAGSKRPDGSPSTTRRVPELLAPAGTPEAFDAALAAGADAVYVGFGNDFNARRSAGNFDDGSLAAAADKAHVAGARVYVAMNVVIKGEEMPAALAQARRAWSLGADALIVQDWGLLAELRRRWPQIECHASTQAAVMDARGVAWARERGCSRVTLARELSLPEIAACAGQGAELEVFAHGALCFCYSGLCLMSSSAGDRSANRGLCAQPCRLPWELVDGDGRRLSAPGRDRPLCPRDLRTLDDLAALADAGVASLKVEGRMKAPEYVFAVTRAYRVAFDALAQGRDLGREERAECDRLLGRAFNRDFTDAYLHGTSGDELMSYGRSNNRGQLVGEVVGGRDLGTVRVRRGGADGGRERTRVLRRAEVEIALAESVGKGDLLEIRPAEDPSRFLTAAARGDAAAGERVVVEAARVMPTGSAVRVIRSQAALDALAGVSGAAPRRIPVDLRVTARLGRPLAVELSVAGGGPSARAEGGVVEAARTRAVTAAEVGEHAGRMGATPFVPASIAVSCDEGVGLPFSAVHRVRAEAAEALRRAILAPYAERAGALPLAPTGDELATQLRLDRMSAPAAALVGEASSSEGGEGETDGTTPQPTASGATPVGRPVEDPAEGRPACVELCVLAPTPAHARAAIRAGATRVYAAADALDEGGTWPGSVPVVPWLDELCREADRGRLDPLVRRGAPVAVGNVSELALAAARGALAEVRPCVPVHNESALLALERAGVAGVWLSGELALSEVCALACAARVPVGLVVLGRPRVMTSEHCVLQATGHCARDCARCPLRRRTHRLCGVHGDLLPVVTDAHGRSRVYAARPLDVTGQLGELVGAGVTRLLVDAMLRTPEQAARDVGRLLAAVHAASAGGRPAPRAHGTTPGHLLSPIR